VSVDSFDRSKGQPPYRQEKGLTLVEVLIGVVIVGILVAMIVPSLGRFVEKGKSTACLGNVKSLVSAYRIWIIDVGGMAPSSGITAFNYSKAFIPEYLPEELRCPNIPTHEARKKSIGFRYAFNDYLRQTYPSLSGFPVPLSRIVLVAECYSFANGFWSPTHLNTTMNGSTGSDLKPQVHSGGLHLGFLDGHAELIKPTGGDWWNPPTYGNKNGGLYYHGTHFLDMKAGKY